MNLARRRGRSVGRIEYRSKYGVGSLDASPPLSNQDQSFQVGIDPTYADRRGRRYYCAIRYAFK
jgi:iron complex outermembrane recepter protein